MWQKEAIAKKKVVKSVANTQKCGKCHGKEAIW
jgi:hypothetical protein